MLDRPVSGRIFFEQVIRDNLDIGRPNQVSLIFNRRIHAGKKRTPQGRFRTRVITEEVTPSLHVDLTYDPRRLRPTACSPACPTATATTSPTPGSTTALFLTRAHDRLLRTGLAQLTDPRTKTAANRQPRPPTRYRHHRREVRTRSLRLDPKSGSAGPRFLVRPTPGWVSSGYIISRNRPDLGVSDGT